MIFSFRYIVALPVFWLVLAGTNVSVSSEPDPALSYQRHAALDQVKGAHSVHLGVAQAGDRLFSVGARGLIMASSDQGNTWQQIPCPIDVTLTTIAFQDNQRGWIGGHEQTLLSTVDGGETWQLKNSDPGGPPLLRIRFFDQLNGIVVGAQGRVLKTTDGGSNWQSNEITDATGFDVHLFDVTRLADGSLIIAAEAGNLFRSTDEGESWSGLPNSPYHGSFFGVTALQNGGLVAFGMLSHAFISADRGDSWQPLQTRVSESSFFSGYATDNGLVLAGANGTFVVGTFFDDTPLFKAIALPGRQTVSDLLLINDNQWLMATDRGPLVYSGPTPNRGER